MNGKETVKCPACNLKKANGELTKTHYETAEELNNFFVSVFNKEDDSEILILNESTKLLFNEDSEEAFDLPKPIQMAILENIQVEEWLVRKIFKEMLF